MEWLIKKLLGLLLQKAQFVLTGLSLSLLLTLSLAQADTGQTATYYEKAQSLYHEKHYNHALYELRKGLSYNPDYLPARILYGEISLAEGSPYVAEVELIEALRMGADALLVYPILAEALLRQWKFTTVLELLKPDPTLSPIAADIFVFRGRAYVGLGDYESALKSFELAQQVVPDSIDSRLGQADIYIRTQKWPKAAILIDEALALQPDNASAWHLKAETLRFNGQPLVSIPHFTKALALDPQRMQARLGRAVAYMNIGQDSLAQRDIAALIEHDPGSAHAHYLMARVKKQQNKPLEARDSLDKVSDILGTIPEATLASHPPSLLLLGLVYFEQRRYEQAHQLIHQFHAINPGHLEGRKLLARVSIVMRRPEVAAEVLQGVSELPVQDIELFVILGDIQMMAGRFRDAYRNYAKALDIAPLNPVLVSRIAGTLMADGDDEGAMSYLIKAFLEEKSSLENAILLGELFIKHGDLSRALALAENLKQTLPEHPSSYNLAARVYLEKNQFSDAENMLQQSLNISHSEIQTWLIKAKCALEQGKINDARSDYKMALRLDTTEQRALVGLAEIAMITEGKGAAQDWLKKLEIEDIQALPALIDLIELYLDEGHLGLAQLMGRRLQGQYPDNPRVLIASALVEVALNRGEQANKMLTQAAYLAKGDAPLLLELARIQASINELKSARYSLSLAIKSDPYHLLAQTRLTQLEIRLNELNNALFRASSIYQASNGSAEGSEILADVLLAMGRFQASAALYAHALVQRYDADIAVKWFEARKRQTSLPEALVELQRLSEITPTDKVVNRLLAFGYMQVGQNAKALEKHLQLIQIDSENAQVFNNLAWLYLKEGDEKAIVHATRAFELAPEDAAVMDTLGWSLVVFNNTEQGLDLLRRAYSRAAREPVVAYHVGAALDKLGRSKEALVYLNQATRDQKEFDGRDDAEALIKKITHMQKG